MTDMGVLTTRPRTRGLAVGGGVALVVVVAIVLWLRGTPDPLPVDDELIQASTPVGQAVYLGVYTVPSDTDRTLQMSGVKIHATSNTEVSIKPLLCRGGSVGVTNQPEPFCDALVNPEGQSLVAGDAIVIQVFSEDPAVAVIDPVELKFSENLQWGTLPAGSGAVVRILPR